MPTADPVTPTSPDLDLFVSHASNDDTKVSQLDALLNAAGITTWVDHEHGITYGDDWELALQQATERCRAGLFVLTPAAAKSIWCQRELRRLDDALQRKLYVVMLEPTSLSQIPMRISGIQYADLTKSERLDDPALRPILDKLIAAIRGQSELVVEAAQSGIQRAQRITGAYPISELQLPLIGRDEDMNKLQEWLAGAGSGSQARIAMLLGLGGVGKTRLAAEVVQRSGLPAGAIWLKFDRDADVERSLDRLGGLIRDHLELDATLNDDETWKRLEGHELLLVLDNAEDCPAALRRQFAKRLELLPAGIRVLITSRYEWDELRLRQSHDLHAPSAEDGVRILEAMAALRQPRNKLNGQAGTLAKAARYHPRLMLYAVGWLNARPPQAVIRALENLAGKDVEAALAEMVQKTVDQMRQQDGDAPYNALRRLAVCSGGFTYEAAEAILAASSADDPSLTVLDTLLAWNLIEMNGSRYDLDPLVRRVVGADESARTAHLDFYLQLTQQQYEKQDYAALDIESANLDEAFAWAEQQKLAERAIDLAGYGGAFLLNRGRVRQKFEWAQRVLPLTKEQENSSLWAKGQHYLGTAYSDLSSLEEREGNLRRAIAAYQEALRFRTPQTAPLDYAGTQNNLGLAYWVLSSVEEREGNLRRAIAAYQEALRFWTPQTAPLDYSMTQNNLGLAYSDLSSLEDREGNLSRAIAAYQEALRFRTPQTAPLDYAMTQNNLGIAYSGLASVEEREGNLHRAIAAYQEALRFWTPQTAPLDYAMTQNNLGNAYLNLSNVEEREDNLRRAIAAYQEALRFWTPQTAPLDYAMTQNNLGTAYSDLSNVEEREDNLRRAIAAYQEALRFYTPQTSPLDYAMTQNNLGAAYNDLSSVEEREANLRRATEAYQEALRFRTPQTAPLAYAMTRANLGLVFQDSDDLSTAIKHWCEAVKYFRLMGTEEYAQRVERWITDAGGNCDDSA